MSSRSLELPALPSLTRQDLIHLALLWLGGFDLRVTLLAVPPMIPAIHRDLGLDEKGISILTGLPVLLLALAAIPGSLLIARLGARRALVAGMMAIGLGSALRGVGPSLVWLFAMTFVMGVGVAVSQPVFPTLTREWFGLRLAMATAVYSNGLLFGEMIPASLTGTLLAPALGGSWPLTLAAWSVPALWPPAWCSLSPGPSHSITRLDLDAGGPTSGVARCGVWASSWASRPPPTSAPTHSSPISFGPRAGRS